MCENEVYRIFFLLNIQYIVADCGDEQFVRYLDADQIDSSDKNVK